MTSITITNQLLRGFMLYAGIKQQEIDKMHFPQHYEVLDQQLKIIEDKVQWNTGDGEVYFKRYVEELIQNQDNPITKLP